MASPLKLTDTDISELESTSTPALTRQNTDVSEISTPPPATPVNEEGDVLDPEPSSNSSKPNSKKVRITAGNGWQAVVKLEEREKKRVKRARSSMSLDDEPRPLQRRAPTRGKLAALPSLPLDILFEIFGHLSPMDLLHLSRTTKPFRRVVMHRSATSLWKEVYAKPEMETVPECPPDLSLPAWTNLVYDTHCHNCLTSNVRNILWMLRIRLCKKCSKTLLFCQSKLNKEKKLDIIIMRCVPFERDTDNGKYCLIKDKEDFLEELEEVHGDRSAFVAKREAEIKARKQHAKLCKKWQIGIINARDAELENLKDERYAFIRKRLVNLGYKPELEFLQMFANHTYAFNVIPPVPKFKAFAQHEEVKQAKAITERAWNNRIKDIMVEYMEGIKQIRLTNDRRIFIDSRREAIAKHWSNWLAEEPQLQRYPPGYFLPTVVDVLEHPRMQVLINEPGERIIPKEEIVALLDGFHDAIKEWRKDKARVLFDFVSDACLSDTGLDPYNPNVGVEWMELAMVVFNCTDFHNTAHQTVKVCDDPTLPWKANSANSVTYYSQLSRYEDEKEDCMWFPEYLHHVCCNARCPSWDDERFSNGLYLGIDRLKVDSTRCLRRKAWSCKTLRFDSKASVVMKHLLQACGLPLTTRTKDLDKLDPRLVCLKCTYGHRCDGERQVIVRTWRETMKHAMQVHWGSNTVRFERISDEDAETARRLEAGEWRRRYRSPQPTLRELRCIHCRDRRTEAGPLTKQGMIVHIDNDHLYPLDPGDVDEPGAEGKIYTKEVWDAPPIQPLPVKMVPKRGYP